LNEVKFLEISGLYFIWNETMEMTYFDQWIVIYKLILHQNW